MVNPHHDAPPNAESAYELPMYFVAHAVNLNVGGRKLAFLLLKISLEKIRIEWKKMILC